MVEIITCSNCNLRFSNNPNKHRHRQKLCPKCLVPYTKLGLKWKPNLNWIKEKLLRKQKKKIIKYLNLRKQVIKSLTYNNNKIPNEQQIYIEILNRLTKPEQEKYLKWEKQRWKQNK